MVSFSSSLGAVGFVKTLVTDITAPSLRAIVWPIQDANGSPVPMSSTDSTPATMTMTGYVPIIEEHRDELVITEHPVEQGAAITDHAYKLPAMLTLRLGWSTSQPANNPLSLGNLTGITALNNIPAIPTLAGFWSTSSDAAINNIYNTLLTFQVNRTLLTVATARRIYQNLLLQGISLQTDDKTEHSLVVTATLKQIILVNAQVVNSPVNSLENSDPAKYNPIQPRGQQNLSQSNIVVSPTTL